MKKTPPGRTDANLREARLELASALASLTDPNEVERFFEDVFTVTEVRDIALRWRIFQLLNAGMTQRDIAETLGVSLCKITRGSRFLKSKKSIVRKLLPKNGTLKEGK